MISACPSCDQPYELSEELLRGRQLVLSCPPCNTSWVVSAGADEPPSSRDLASSAERRARRVHRGDARERRDLFATGGIREDLRAAPEAPRSVPTPAPVEAKAEEAPRSRRTTPPPPPSDAHTGIIDLAPLLAAGGRLRAERDQGAAPVASPLGAPSPSSPPEGMAISLVPRALSAQRKPIQVGFVVGGGAVAAILLGLGIGALLRPNASELPKTEPVVAAMPLPAAPLPPAPAPIAEPTTAASTSADAPKSTAHAPRKGKGAASFKSKAPVSKPKPVDKCGCGTNLQCAIRCAQR